MTVRHVTRSVLLAASLVPSLAVAQADTAHKPTLIGPPIRKISTASALSTEDIGAITGVLELHDGRVLVNDGTRRRLLLMDTALKTVEVVLDSLAEVANTYGTRPGMLIPYRADSVIFVDPASVAALILDPQTHIARVRSAWRTDDLFQYANPNGNMGLPATDGRGRVVYRISARPGPPKVAPPPGVPYFPSPPDSAFVVSIDLDTRAVDTLGVVKVPRIEYQIRQSAEGFFSINAMVNPLPNTDEWAVLPDGDIAFLRGRDYRVEYRHPDGTGTSSGKVPFDWQRLNDDDKQKVVDSLKDANRRSQMAGYMAQMIRWTNMYNRPYPKGFTVPANFSPQNGLSKDWKLPPGVSFPPNYIYACAAGEEPKIIQPSPGAASASPASAQPPTPLPGAFPGIPGGPPIPRGGTPSCIPSPITVSGGLAPPPPAIREIYVIPPDELPDYRPPFSPGAMRADADGNLWVHTNPSKPIPGGLVYDILNDKGDLTDRLQIPPGYTLVGFGKGKIVYLSMRDAKGIHLARVRLK
jgi:hypothetical protein